MRTIYPGDKPASASAKHTLMIDSYLMMIYENITNANLFKSDQIILHLTNKQVESLVYGLFVVGDL